ncbi:translation initiation factor IF-2 [Candidatus Woesearchaeota archaeon]|nr:translation initiation factor IF-2 [Candidatus Woesearchaeota archaeon]
MTESDLRSPIVSVLGHVDHGKSSILDAVRESNIVSKEAGAITQAIGASIVPLEVIKSRCSILLDQFKLDFSVPGLLFIDTPGHAAFTSLRKRGGALADIAVLVVDINEGFKPQTFEAVEILRANKTPFVIAANKVDLLPGFNIEPFKKSCSLSYVLSQQSDNTKQMIDDRIYSLIGQFYERFHMNAERFDRVDDYTKQIAIIPCSAKTRIGIAEVLMLITGLAQRFLEQNLKINASGPARGTVLEVKDSEGLGKTLDVIIYDGMLNVNDTVIIGALGEPIVTKIRALFQPSPLHEMRDKKSQFVSIKKALAATGVRISAPGLENAVAGMPLQECGGSPERIAEARERIRQEIEEVLIDTDMKGVIIKADSLGSVEAMLKLFGEKDVKVRKASIGDITKKDILDAESNYEQDPFLSVIIAFNVGVAKGVDVPPRVKVIKSDIIYRLLDEYETWTLEKKKSLEAEQLDLLTRPCKVEVLQNCIFRQSNPAIVGVYVMTGRLKVGTPLMKNDGKPLTSVKSIQSEQESMTVLEEGKQAAVSLPNVVCGRQLNEGNILYSAIPEDEFKKLKKLRKYLSEAEVQVMKEIAEMMRKQNIVWGV